MPFFTRVSRSPASNPATPQDDSTANGQPEPADVDGTPDRAAAAEEAADGGEVRGKRPLAARVVTALACLLVLFALIVPNQLDRVTPAALVRVPVEALVGVAVVLLLPARIRRVAAALAGVVLGLLAIVKIIDMGFFNVLSRQFEPLIDWTLFPPAVDYLTKTSGRAGAIAAVIGVVVLAVAVIIFMTLAVLRLTRIVARHRLPAARSAVVLGIVWVTCAALGAQLVPNVPVAAIAVNRPFQLRAGLQDREEFAAEALKDPFRHTPGDQLLTALRGKDLLLTFIESYGRVAIEDPELAPRVNAMLDAGNRRLNAAGFASRSAFLRSPTTGGVSWLAHATLLSGMWIDNQQRYDHLVKTDRLTLNGAFRRANWRTVGVMPGVTKAWPEAKFFSHDRVIAAKDMGYRGPVFSWSPMPDQFALSVFQRAERDKKHAPLMAEIPLTSTHSPWAPIPKLLDWDDLGDGSVYKEHASAGRRPDVVWRDPAKVRTEYRRSIEYSLSTLFSYVEEFGDDDMVLVFLGDHQPYSIVTGPRASWDVPITIVARDQTVLDRISGWGWHNGLRPGARAPVWRMDTFRDRFLTAFGSQARSAARSPAPPKPR